jgi:predicted  nucleic acid-binding Zn-ribbon protein
MDASDPRPEIAEQARDIEDLRTELERLRSLVGPSEKSYEDLKADARNARDAARRAELEAGRTRATIIQLENEVRRWQRDFVWFRNQIVRRLPQFARFLNRGRQP